MRSKTSCTRKLFTIIIEDCNANVVDIATVAGASDTQKRSVCSRRPFEKKSSAGSSATSLPRMTQGKGKGQDQGRRKRWRQRHEGKEPDQDGNANDSRDQPAGVNHRRVEDVGFKRQRSRNC